MQFGHTAFFKKKKDSKKMAKTEGAKVKKTKHFLRGSGYLVYK